MSKSALAFFAAVAVWLLVLAVDADRDGPSVAALAKRSLMDRAREFLKLQPMGDNLLKILHKFRPAKHSRAARSKRSQKTTSKKSSVYVLNNNKLAGGNKLKKRFNKNNLDTTNKYTLIPLVVPLAQLPILNNLKVRTLNQENEIADSYYKDLKGLELSTNTGQLINLDDTTDPNNSSQEAAVLHKILNEVESLMETHNKDGIKREGLICTLDGNWISVAGGMRLEICFKNASSAKKFRATITETEPASDDGFLCNGNWTMVGEVPFVHSGLVVALASRESDKHVATFIGECRVCEGTETVTGTWMMGRTSRDCKDEKASHQFFSDVWKRENVRDLQKKHLEEIGLTAPLT